jgi:hypothetical protein
VARLWGRGYTLYRDTWVDRPQGLILVFRGLHLVAGSAVAMRAAAALVAALVVAATIVLALRLAGGRITAVAAGLLAGTVGASPYLESFTFSGELLASLVSILSLLAFTEYLRRRQAVWLVAAGLLAGCAVLVKQSAMDAGLAAVAYLLWRRRPNGLPAAAAFVLLALVPVAIAAAAATSFHDWWYAVVRYRLDGDSLLSGSPALRWHQFWTSAAAAAQGLGLLVALALVGWRGAPLLVRLWLAAAVLGVLGGGAFHPHYYLQLVPPLSLLAALGVRRLWLAGSRAALAAAAAAGIASVGVAVPIALASPRDQARAIWPHDPHLQHDAALARYVASHSRGSERILAIWADADLYYLADRDPAIPYLWERNVEAIPSALDGARSALVRGRPRLVVVVQPPGKVDPSGRTAAILHRRYRLAARVEGVPVYRRRT